MNNRPMLKKILIVLTFLIAALLAFAFFQPDKYTVTRTSQPIKATPQEVYNQIADFGNWNKWSPWHQLDPQMQETFGGPSSGQGSIYSWTSAQDGVGSGRMEIVSATPPSDVNIRLDFLSPMEATANTQFKIGEAATGGTQVTWTMSGDMDYMSKVMNVFGTMDKMIGKDFEKGLSQLKAHAEK